MSAKGRKRPWQESVESKHYALALPPSLAAAASLVDLRLYLGLNLSEQGLGFLAGIHAPRNQHIPVGSENYRK